MFQIRYVLLAFFFLLTSFMTYLLTLISINPILIFIFFTLNWSTMIYLYLMKKEIKFSIIFTILISFLSICVFFLIIIESIAWFLIFYEALLIPSTILVFLSSYTNRRWVVTLYFIFWTQFGSFLLLVAIFTIIKQDIHMFDELKNLDPTPLIPLLLFIGFGIKLPTWPFQNWITKTHVEVPTSFSIFLSGVLVKIALIGLLRFHDAVFPSHTWFLFTILLLGVIDTFFKIPTSSDFKKLIALTTVLEMNLFATLVIFNTMFSLKLIKLFFFTHSIFAAFLFFWTDMIFSRYLTRITFQLFGSILNTPLLGFLGILFLFSFIGCPLTIPFLIEYNVFLSF